MPLVNLAPHRIVKWRRRRWGPGSPKRLLAQVCFLGACVGWHVCTAQADPERLSEHRDWRVYAYYDSGKRYCYAASFPIRRRGDTEGWPDSWLLVSNEPNVGTRHAISFVLGRPLAPEAIVRANVGTRPFELYAEGDTAWTADTSVDLRLVVAMKRGRRLLISASAASGERVLDTFSLMGFTQALETLGAQCR